jgi:phosphatidylglycerol---prolipoprotein diacylglyceryl transferase
MCPILFRWYGRPVYSHPAMLYAGLTLGLVLGNLEANLRGLDGTRVYIAAVLLVVPALAGARLAYIIGHWQSFRPELVMVWRRSVGGYALYGGLLAVPVSVPLLAALGAPFWAFWDTATFTILVGMVFTRVGCLLQGCCGGKATAGRFGLIGRGRDGLAVRRIPTQLLEAGLGAALLGGAAAIPPEAPGGVVFLAALVGYAAGRLLLQGTREAEQPVGGLGAQRTSPALLAAAALALLMLFLLGA